MKGHAACLHLLEGMSRVVDRREAARLKSGLFHSWQGPKWTNYYRLPGQVLPIRSPTHPARLTLILAPRSR